MAAEKNCLNEANPYAYFPDSDAGMAVAWEHFDGNDEEPSTVEPRTPFSVHLHNPAFLRIRDLPCTMTVSSKYLKIEAEELPEPIILPRDDAFQAITIFSNGFFLNLPDRNMLEFRMWKFEGRELVLGRLQLWAEYETQLEPITAVKKIEEFICRNCSELSRTLAFMCGLIALVLFCLLSYFLFFDPVTRDTLTINPTRYSYLVAINFAGLSFAAVNLGMLYIIRRGKTWGFIGLLVIYALLFSISAVSALFYPANIAIAIILLVLIIVMLMEYLHALRNIAILRNENSGI